MVASHRDILYWLRHIHGFGNAKNQVLVYEGRRGFGSERAEIATHDKGHPISADVDSKSLVGSNVDDLGIKEGQDDAGVFY